MKILITWSDKDIEAGIIIGAPGKAERYMIGYTYLDEGDDLRRVFTINSLTDGLVTVKYSRWDVAKFLNKAGLIPAAIIDADPALELTVMRNENANL